MYPFQSFENSGFMDLDYADPTPLMHDAAKDDDEDNLDMDSGYQEPQEVLSASRVISHHSSANNSPVPSQTLYNPHNGQFITESSSSSSPRTSAGGHRRKHRQHHHSSNNFHGSRPVVSEPTRIENPNVLPPLNLFPQQQAANTMGRFQGNTATIGSRSKGKYVTADRHGGGGSSMTASLNRRLNEFTASRNCADI